MMTSRLSLGHHLWDKKIVFQRKIMVFERKLRQKLKEFWGYNKIFG